MKPKALSPAHYVRKAWHGVSLVLLAFAVNVVCAPAALAGGGGGGAITDAIRPAADILQEVSDALTGDLGIIIGTLAFVFVGVYIMYARSTGQALGSVAKVIIGLVILFGGATMVAGIQTTGAMI